MPWEFTPAPETAVQDITVDASALAARVPFAAQDSDPAHMVRVWSAVRDAA